MDDFSKVKIGDKLWSAEAGWVVVDITEPAKSTTLYVRTLYNKYKEFDMQGIPLGYPEYPQSLFFNKMVLIPSPVPKPKEEVSVTFDPNKPYQRRDGKPARIAYTFQKGHHFVVLDDTDGWIIVYADGRYGKSEGYSEYDLVNIPEKIEGWMNVYKNNKVYANKSMADDVGYDRIACIPVSFIKGEGLNESK